jgi:hypothetical protein
MMPNVIEVSAQINVYHSRQPLQYPLGYSIYCLMGMTPRPVPVGAPPEVRFKDRLKDQFQCVIYLAKVMVWSEGLAE